MEVLIVLLFVVVITIFAGLKIVSQGEEWVVERLGKFNKTLKPSLNVIIPYMDKVREKISTRDIILDIPRQEVITRDNAVILTNAITFARVTNPKDAIYGIEDFKLAIQNLIMTTLRSIIGEMKLNEALSNREVIKARLKEQIVDDAADWGVTVKSVEIQNITPSTPMQKAIEQQATAAIERRAIETKAEGDKNAMVLEAQGKLEAARKEASTQAIKNVSEAIHNKESPTMFLLGDRYINTLEKMSQSPNSKFVVYPADLLIAIKGILGNVLKK